MPEDEFETLRGPHDHAASATALRPSLRSNPAVRLSYRDDSPSRPCRQGLYGAAAGGRRRSATVGSTPLQPVRIVEQPTNAVAAATAATAAVTTTAGEAGDGEGGQSDRASAHSMATNVRSYIAGRGRALSNAVFGAPPRAPEAPEDPEAAARRRAAEERAQYDQQVIDLLDVIDPEVSTLSTLSDVQNSLFIPHLGRWVDRTRYLSLTRPPPGGGGESPGEPAEAEAGTAGAAAPPGAGEKPVSRMEGIKRRFTGAGAGPALTPVEERTSEFAVPTTGRRASPSVSSVSGSTATQEVDPDAPPKTEGKYLILPQGLVDWDAWTGQEKEELDDYVRHLLHSRKWKLRRTLRGFRHYVSTPLGAFVTIYASLLTFWGAAWVLFLIGWLSAGSRQGYFVEICDQILTALFCVVGIGLAPFRAVDTYHMIYIAHYHRKSLRLYREQGAAPLPDENDLPDPLTRLPTNGADGADRVTSDARADGDLARAEEGREPEVRKPVLTVYEQATFLYHQAKFTKSHTFYRPHETTTHKAFPLDLLIVVVCLLDFHSIFQIALGSTTWSISYHESYKKILTSIILSFSISCNITAGLVIMVGNRRTRKVEVIEARLRQAVTEEAIRRKAAKKERLEREREREREKAMRGSEDAEEAVGFIEAQGKPGLSRKSTEKRRRSLDLRRKSVDKVRMSMEKGGER